MGGSLYFSMTGGPTLNGNSILNFHFVFSEPLPYFLRASNWQCNNDLLVCIHIAQWEGGKEDEDNINVWENGHQCFREWLSSKTFIKKMLRKAHNGEGGGDYICLFSCSSNAEETCLSKISRSIQFDHVISVVFLNFFVSRRFCVVSPQ